MDLTALRALVFCAEAFIAEFSPFSWRVRDFVRCEIPGVRVFISDFTEQRE
jgi:hypothetical protein